MGGDCSTPAVENLDRFPPDINMKVLEQIPASLCIDIGHLWRDGRDALPYLEAYLGRARVVHLHGVGERDHQSLELTAPETLAQDDEPHKSRRLRRWF